MNLETAIALSTNSNMTSQIQSGSHQPKETPISPHFIPNSQSDDEIIQDFTLGDSGLASKQSPPTTVILPVNSSSMGPAPSAAESREPGWSAQKFYDTTSSTRDPSTHLKTNQPDSSSSSKQTPQPPILENLSRGSSSSSSRPKPRPPRLGAASIEQARERLKLAQSADSLINPASSSTTDQSLPHPFDPTRTKSKPSEVVLAQAEAMSRKVSEHPPPHDVEILPTGQSLRTSNKLTPRPPETSIPLILNSPSRKESPDAQPNSFKRKRKTKVQQVAEKDLPLGPEKPSAKSDSSGKRVRKQSAAGKASAKSLQILLNLSQSSNDTAEASLKQKEPAVREESQTARRRRVYRDGWVLASDPDPEPVQDASRQVPVTTENQVTGSAHQSPKENPVSHQAPVPNEISSHPFLEIISSPLSSPSGFSADEMNIKASKRSKTSPVPKKRAPKKKVAPKAKGKAAKIRKKTAADTESNASAVVIEEPPHVDSLANKTNHNRRQQNNPSPEVRLQVPAEEAPKSPSQSPTQTRLRQSPRQRPERNNDVVSAANTRVSTEAITDADKASSPRNSRKAGPSATKPVQTSTKAATNQSGEVETGKKVPIKVKKGMSLAEILAMTNPKTKRGIRIGLPREEKHRLHININPNPPVQKQVKKKLKVKRGEYDSGEDDTPSKNSASESEDGQNGLSAKKSSQPKNRVIVDDEEPDEDQDVQDNVELDDGEY